MWNKIKRFFINLFSKKSGIIIQPAKPIITEPEKLIPKIFEKPTRKDIKIFRKELSTTIVIYFM